MNGLLVVDKPVGPTSHDVVARVRRILGERRVGHTGTLDPLASGVLPLVVGRATRLARFLSASDKEYDATIRLGVATDSGDADGGPIGSEYRGPLPARVTVDRALDPFRGTFLQQPPALSAKKIRGRRSHRLERARLAQVGRSAAPCGAGAPSEAEDTEPTLTPVSVATHSVEILSLDGDRLTLRIVCTAGFYVRSLARDLGERLGTGAHLAALRRTRSGDVTLSQAVALPAIEQGPEGRDRAMAALVPMAEMLPGFPRCTLTAEGAHRAIHGRDIGIGELSTPTIVPAAGFVRLLDHAGALVGVGEPAATPGLLHPVVVLV